MLTSQEYKDMSIREFTKAADKYDSNNPGVYSVCRKDYAPLFEEVAKEPFSDLLDAGCGTGPMLKLLTDDYHDAHFTGIDLTPKMIEVAREKNLPNTQLVVGDCENLPFDADSFDVVICCESFHHYPNPQNFFNSAARVLRPGGRLIVIDYAASGAIHWLVNHVEMPLLNKVDHGDVAVRSKQEYLDFAKNAGLTSEEFRSMGVSKVMAIFRK